MLKQSQWLFEAPFTLETISETNPYSADAEDRELSPDESREANSRLIAKNWDENKITDLIFFKRHPKLKGQALNKENKEEWIIIRDELRCLATMYSCSNQKPNDSDWFFKCGDDYILCRNSVLATTKQPAAQPQNKPTPPPKKSAPPKQNKPAQKKSTPSQKKPSPAKQKKPNKGLIDIEMANLEYYNPELESEWGFPESNYYSYPLGEEEWEQVASCPSQNNLAIWIGRFARYGNTIQALPREEQARIGQIARHIISSYGPGCQPIRTIRLIGHADRDLQRGAAFEKKISGDRAQVVQEALIRAINNPKVSQQITWQRTAEGASQLIVRNPKTESDRARNRRVEVILITSPSLQPSCAEECKRDFQRCLQTPSTREQCLQRLRSCQSDCRGRPV
jgi:flagellar motor protein MotB